MRRHLIALALPLMMALPVRAQDLPYDTVTLTTDDAGKQTSIEVAKDGHYKITKPNGREIEGTLSAGERYAVAASSGRAGFLPSHPDSLGNGEGLPFTLEARTGDHSYSVTGNEGSLTLGSFEGLVRTLQAATLDRTDGFIARWLFTPKLPNALELTLTKGYDKTGTLTILDDGTVRYTDANGRTRESKLTDEEASEIAKSVKRVDRSGFIGPTSGPVTGTQPGFKIVVYETWHQYLLEGELGSYGASDEVGSLVVTLEGVLGRLGVEIAPAADDKTSSDKGSLFPDMLDNLNGTFRDLRAANVTPADRGARTTGLAGSIILDREHAATDDAKGDKAGER